MTQATITADRVSQPRTIERIITGQAVMDGAGVKINRVLTQPLQRRLDPFLMLDQFGSDKANDYIAGFPEHPHRGFETVTYMITGRMRHRDSAGNEGLLTNGGVQWMTAGHGVIHSEMPEQEEGVMEGVQREVTEPIYLDIALPAGATFSQILPEGHNVFIYTFRGEVGAGDKAVPLGRMAIFANTPGADGIVLRAATDSRVVLIAGRPLNEPIAQYGPFVMNTQAELQTAVEDFRAGRLGEYAEG
jgi:redox-sensitive bicupin YhaK (pirin superfamily)